MTMPASAASRFIEDLTKIGASARDIGVSGRYHSAIHAGTPQKILMACQAHFSPSYEGHPLVRSNTDAHLLVEDEAALSALECILGERADWYRTMSTVTSALDKTDPECFVLSIGSDAVPQSIARTFPIVKATMIFDHMNDTTKPKMPAFASGSTASAINGYPKDSIAIIGMGCRFPGADSVDEFWSLLTQGKSMLSEMPEARFGRGRPARSNSSLRFWGNFLQDIEAFDHGFFKKSPREAISMDPQQRILLQVAYEALESSGYFAESSRPKDVGCYIGACATDYDFNVASHPPTAYSAIGTLRSFLSGKLSHYFGWSGPSLVLDTACSSSAVAIHTACTALRTGQCSQALAGGITLMTSPYLFENFAAAHFLSPTGGSKSFSADADGYCRGEGGGLVVLKRLSDAVRDNDHISGVIAGSAVNQNDNCVPITVPHSSSQGNLYEKVLKQAGLEPHKVAFVEAHGTGTPVGDPIEMESIRRVFGGPDRDAPLVVSSTKGNIGHLEGASGVAALIKAIMQMEHRIAPRQALFTKLNPKISPLESDNLCIPVSNLELPEERLAACVNNYGAAGSNAAMIIIEAPCKELTEGNSRMADPSPPKEYPFQITAASTKSLLTYCAILEEFCQRLRYKQSLLDYSQITSDLSFSLATRLNQGLSFSLTFTASDLDQVQAQLRQQHATSNAIRQHSKAPPVVLCFGGQVSDKVALDKRLWQECALFRAHLDKCDTTLHALGFSGIYPEIFQIGTVTDVVVLHSILFATQYACAQTWLQSGLKVDALVGHSFGQLTAMCVSGILSLRDGLRLVAGRASLMLKHWGPEPGTMIAVEADKQTLEELRTVMRKSNGGDTFEIACLNGQKSHVVVSDEASAQELEAKLTELALRYRRLNVPFGFHSRFTEPLLPHIHELASSLALQESKIPLETCTDANSWEQPTAKLVTDHTREPVFFGQAIQRLHTRLGPCTWLEAGSDSSVMSMVRRALGQSSTSNNNFVSLQLNKANSSRLVIDATVALWNTGHQVQFWNFHQLQRPQYGWMRLPPYAWEKSKHWLELDMSKALNSGNKIEICPPTNTAAPVGLPPALISLDSIDSCGHHFVVNPRSKEYQTIVRNVEILGNAACPPALYIDLVSRAARIVDGSKRKGLLSIQGFQIHSPLALNINHSIILELKSLGQGWRFQINSADKVSNSTSTEGVICHAEGMVDLRPTDDSLEEAFSRYERLIDYKKMASIADDPGSELLRGNVMYKMLAPRVTYPEWYHGVRTLAAANSQLIAKVINQAEIPKIVSEETTIQLPLMESFIQVAYLHANCLHEGSNSVAAFRFAGADHIQFSPEYDSHSHRGSAEASWGVVAYASVKNGEVTYDMFIHNELTSQLVLLLLGVHLTSFSGPTAMEAESNDRLDWSIKAPTSTQINAEEIKLDVMESLPAVSQPQVKQTNSNRDSRTSIHNDICGILERLADIPRDRVTGNATFDSLDIDSLMIIEIIGELSTLFQVELPIDEMVELTDINSLVTYLHGKGCVGHSFGEDGDSSSSLSSSQASSTNASSPPDSPRKSAEMTPPRLKMPVEGLDSIVPKSKLPRVVPILATDTKTKPVEMGHHGIQDVFERLRFDFAKYADQTGAKGFWTDVYPQQADLVCAYVVEAYQNLGCDISSLSTGQILPSVDTLPRHKHLMAQLRNILVDSGLLQTGSSQELVRTAKTLGSTAASIQFEQMLRQYPFHTSETKLLNVTGPLLAECLSGQKDPLPLLFGNRYNLELLADFYANSLFCTAATRLLAEFVHSTFLARQTDGVLSILEVGAGTGGTTKYLLDFLTRCGVSFEYTFTDVSQSLVSQARKKFSSFPQMRYMTFDCDRSAPQELLEKFHFVISTNCIHATKNITTSAANILPVIRNDGALCVVEFTRNLYWFDLVFGLLGGWWLFSDGRQHALANESFWSSSLYAAGFKHVSWTDGDTEEEKTLRLICGFKSEAKEESSRRATITKRAGVPMEEIVWKKLGTLDLSADIYFPKTPDPPEKKRPLGAMNSEFLASSFR